MRRVFLTQILRMIMKTTVIKIALQTSEHVLKNEGINLNSLKINVQSEDAPDFELPFSKLKALCDAQLDEFDKEENRLMFLVENRLRVERWNTSPMTQLYYVMNDEDTSIAQHSDLYKAIDIAIEKIKSEESE